MRTGVVIPVGPGRLENLTDVLHSIADGLVQPEAICLVGDGPEATRDAEVALDMVRNEIGCQVFIEALEKKHEPGMPQPRNMGVRALDAEPSLGDLTHVWFLDSDCKVEPECLLAFEWANFQDKPDQRILAGRYDWLREGAEEPEEGLEMLDPRSASFEAHNARQTFVGDLSAGLACFSGNLVWPIRRFKHVGGFWNEIHHGRCEDGELGLRAVQLGIPIAYVGIARAYHLWHERNAAWAAQANARDVPMLNERHPWVESRCTCGHQRTLHMLVEGERSGQCRDCTCEGFTQAVFMVEEDGRRFNARCECGWEGNTAEIWAHESSCPLSLRGA